MSTKTEKLSFYSFICGLLVLIAIIVYRSHSILCIDSNIIQNIDLIDGKQESKIYSCNSRKNVPYSATLVEYKTQIESRINLLERVLVDSLGQVPKFEVHVFKGKKDFLQVSDANIHLSEDLFLRSGVLEKLLITQSFQIKLGPINRLLLEAASDLIWYQTVSRKKIPGTDHDLKSQDSQWPQVLMSLNGYCRSSWRLLEHEDFCKKANSNYSLSLSLAPIDLSLRPLFSKSWMSAYDSLSVQSRLNFNKKIAPLLLHLQARIRDEETPWRKIENLTEVRSLDIQWPDKETVENFWFAVQKQLSKNNLNSASLHGQVHFDYVLELERQEEVPLLLNDLKSKNLKNLNIAIIFKEKLWFSPFSAALDRNLFKHMTTTNWLKSQCGTLNSESIKSYITKATRFLVYDHCDDSAVKTESLWKRGLAGFISENKEVSFLQFYMPGFELAFARIQKEPVLDSQKALSVIGWQNPKWDESLLAHQTQSAIEALEWFRLKSESQEKLANLFVPPFNFVF